MPFVFPYIIRLGGEFVKGLGDRFPPKSRAAKPRFSRVLAVIDSAVRYRLRLLKIRINRRSDAKEEARAAT